MDTELVLKLLISLVNGPVGNFVIELLKRVGLKSQVAIRLLSALICAALAAGALALQGVLDWKLLPAAIASGLVGWLLAHTQHKLTDESARGGGAL